MHFRDHRYHEIKSQQNFKSTNICFLSALLKNLAFWTKLGTIPVLLIDNFVHGKLTPTQHY